MKNPMDLYEDYAKEMEEDTTINSVNVMEKQFSSPNVKHKWLYRLGKNKRVLLDLIELKDNFVNKQLTANNPLNLSKGALAAKSGNDPTYKELQSKIKDQEILVEYLDSAVNKIFSQMGFDFRNLVEMMKQEQL
jgi:hypothetical protein